MNRRTVLQATGGAVTLGLLGSRVVGGQSGGDCEGGNLADAPADLPEIDLQPDDPTATNLPTAPEDVVIFCYGYDTSYDRGRREAATLQSALERNGYTGPVVLAHWESQPEAEAESGIDEAENFEEVAANADRDGSTFATWLATSYTEARVHLAGHSTGGRVVLRALTELAGSSVGIETVSLFGPSVASERVCTDDDEFDLSAAGAVAAYFSRNDERTCDPWTEYHQLFSSETGAPVLGCEGAQCGDTLPENFTDHDVTDSIDSHCSYFYPDIGVGDRVVSAIGSTEGDASDGDEDSNGDDEGSEGDGETGVLEASVSFSDQTTDGDAVIVDSAQLEEGGFVSIHDGSLEENDTIESTVGVSSYLLAGDHHEDVAIELEEPLESSQTMTAIAHRETNHNDDYDFGDSGGEDDTPYLNADGQAVTDSAQVTVEDGEDATDGDSTDGGTDGDNGDTGDDGTDGNVSDDTVGDDETGGTDEDVGDVIDDGGASTASQDSDTDTEGNGTANEMDGDETENGTDDGDGRAGADGDAEASADATGPGFGILTTIVGLAGGGYVLSRRFADDERSSD